MSRPWLVDTALHTHNHIHVYIYIYVYMYICKVFVHDMRLHLSHPLYMYILMYTTNPFVLVLRGQVVNRHISLSIYIYMCGHVALW